MSKWRYADSYSGQDFMSRFVVNLLVLSTIYEYETKYF